MFGIHLAERDQQPEMMDQPGLPVAQHQDALRGLARINWISRSANILWQPIRRLALTNGGRRLRVLDLATGGGDVPIGLHRRARLAGIDLDIAGADISNVALDFARGRAQYEGAAIEFFALDALHDTLPSDFDVITSSLFLHHVPGEETVGLLSSMAEAARRMILINDLIRSRLGYVLAWLGTRTLSRSPIVHQDGPMSVRAAFTMAEAEQMAQKAGLREATVSWRWPFRFLLQWSRT
jgi:2-polyprenyl-3-methyl-5-hydroxy-6-metoxy-1,4-benzoquinol methylase